MTAAEKAVEVAKSFKGKRNKIVEVYNSYLPHPRNYRVRYKDKLCASYMSAIFISLGWTDIVPPECGAYRLYLNMQNLGRGILDRKRIPEIGDLIFFGSGTNAGSINHVGIVTEVRNEKQIYYWDVNAVVGQHTCPVGYGAITGYGIPNYEIKSAPVKRVSFTTDISEDTLNQLKNLAEQENKSIGEIIDGLFEKV